jgi:hypothetical protein
VRYVLDIGQLDGASEDCETHRKLRPGWRNWQTQETQNLPAFGPWGFDSLSGHHIEFEVAVPFVSPYQLSLWEWSPETRTVRQKRAKDRESLRDSRSFGAVRDLSDDSRESWIIAERVPVGFLPDENKSADAIVDSALKIFKRLVLLA